MLAHGSFHAEAELASAAFANVQTNLFSAHRILLCEAFAIYGVVFSIIMSTYFSGAAIGDSLQNRLTGFCLLSAGCTVGITNLMGGIGVGKIGSLSVLADAASGGKIYPKILVLQIFASAIGIYGIIAGFVQLDKAVPFV